jgi:hypothetical protein
MYSSTLHYVPRETTLINNGDRRAMHSFSNASAITLFGRALISFEFAS